MGTRSTILFKGDGFEWKIYQQYDGYHDGVGKELAEFFAKVKIVNGYNNSHKTTDEVIYANGFGCAVLQFLAEIKNGIGSPYATSLDDSQEYNYTIEFTPGDDYYSFGSEVTYELTMTADGFYDEDADKDLPNFEGTPEEFLDKIKENA